MEIQYDIQEFRNLIESELTKRKLKNRNYSLRRFAMELEIPPGRLSEVLSGKRKISNQLAGKISDKLALTPTERSALNEAKRKIKSGAQESFVLTEDIFAMVADWQHYAVLNLIQTKDFDSDENWIGKRLNLPPFDVRLILSRLERLDLISRNGKSIIRTKTNLSTLSDIPSGALRRAHKLNLERAADALEEVELNLRDMTSIMMSIDSSKINLAKKRIAAFRKEMAALLETGYRDEVYNLCISLYPVTRRDRK